MSSLVAVVPSHHVGRCLVATAVFTAYSFAHMVALLSDVLERGAFFGETHSIKGWLAAKRLAARFPALLPLIGDLGQWNQLLSAPRVTGLLSEHVQWDTASAESRRLRLMISGAVFPVAYAAACELVRREGTHSRTT
jgi:hypothetical protein